MIHIGINVEKNVTAKLSIKFGDSLNADVYSIIEVLTNSNSNLELIIDADTAKEIQGQRRIALKVLQVFWLKPR